MTSSLKRKRFTENEGFVQLYGKIVQLELESNNYFMNMKTTKKDVGYAIEKFYHRVVISKIPLQKTLKLYNKIYNLAFILINCLVTSNYSVLKMRYVF